MLVRCTRKMLDLLGSRGASPPTDDDWYLNLLWIDRQKCALLAHQGTLLSVFRARVRSAHLRAFGNYVVAAIESELHSEGLAGDTLGVLQRDDVRIARTATRSTLGFMDQMAVELRYRIAYEGGLARCDIDALNYELRRTPRSHGDCVYPRPTT